MKEAIVIEVNNKKQLNLCNACNFHDTTGVILIKNGVSMFICQNCFDDYKQEG